MPDGENLTWYVNAKANSDLEQGGILLVCKIPTLVKKDSVIKLFELSSSFVVLNQSCDLIIQPNKEIARAEHILLAEVQALDLSRENYLKIYKGQQPGLYVLPRRSSKSEPKTNLVINFNRLHTIKPDLLPDLSKVKRVRLRTPYREHMIQAFANTYARIALDQQPKLG
jgi:hypothetical protein